MPNRKIVLGELRTLNDLRKAIEEIVEVVNCSTEQHFTKEEIKKIKKFFG